MWWNTLLLSLREIRRNLLRSFLTMLGIVIGVAAVITMVTLGNGATRAVAAKLGAQAVFDKPLDLDSVKQLIDEIAPRC